MKTLALITTLLISLSTLGNPVPIETIIPASPRLMKIKFIPTKVGYRHISLRQNKRTKADLVINAIEVSDQSDLRLNTNQEKKLNQLINLLKRNSRGITFKNSWKRFIKSLKNQSKPIDLNSIINFTLRESYLETTGDLRYYARKVDAINKQKEAIRNQLQGLNNLKNDIRRRVTSIDTVTAETLNAEIDRWEEQLSTIGDDAQLANIDLQNALQKQQQTIQTLSNVSKMMNDTAMAIIRNLR